VNVEVARRAGRLRCVVVDARPPLRAADPKRPVGYEVDRRAVFTCPEHIALHVCVFSGVRWREVAQLTARLPRGDHDLTFIEVGLFTLRARVFGQPVGVCEQHPRAVRARDLKVTAAAFTFAFFQARRFGLVDLQGLSSCNVTQV
jgi:hypothetical protein